MDVSEIMSDMRMKVDKVKVSKRRFGYAKRWGGNATEQNMWHDIKYWMAKIMVGRAHDIAQKK